ncbi:MAG: DUF2834 domain-containing protein [Solimonas sp.]
MGAQAFRTLLWLLGGGFLLAFCIVVVPPLLAQRDLVAAALGGFVNPYASGYSLDTIFCWFVLAVWIIHEAHALKIRHGWIALLLGLAPGVATGFAFYLLLRSRQLTARGGPA